MSCWFSLFPFSKVGTRCISRPPDLRTKIWGEILGLYTGIDGKCNYMYKTKINKFEIHFQYLNIFETSLSDIKLHVLKLHRYCYDVDEIKGKSVTDHTLGYLKCVQFYNFTIISHME